MPTEFVPQIYQHGLSFGLYSEANPTYLSQFSHFYPSFFLGKVGFLGQIFGHFLAILAAFLYFLLIFGHFCTILSQFPSFLYILNSIENKN